MDRLHVRHLVRSDGFAGVERYLTYAGVELARRGHEVSIVGGQPERMRAALAGSTVTFAPAGSWPATIRATVASPRPDIVHSHMTAADVAAIVAHARLRRPMVSTLHFAGGRGHDALTRRAYRAIGRPFDRQLAISAFVAQGVSAPVTVVPLGIPDLTPAAGGGSRQPVVLVVQRLEAEKDTDTALRAWARCGLAADGWELHVAGVGAQRDALARLAHELTIGPSVRWLGHVDDVADRMQAASVLLAPTPAEGFGLTVVEAMAARLAVVAADGGGHVETLGPVSRRTLFPPGDVAAAAERLRTLASDASARAELGARLRKRYEQEYTVARHVDRLEAIYADVLSARTRA